MTEQLPIVAVTVFPDRARVTRRGEVRLAAGEQRVSIGPLPLGLLRDSVRVAGHGPATVLGVDVVTWRQPVVADPAVAGLRTKIKDLADSLAALADADAVAAAREEFLNRLAMRSAGTLAGADTGPAGQFADGLEQQLTALHTGRRERETSRTDLQREKEALERRLADLSGRRRPDQLAAEVLLDVVPDEDTDAGETVEIELELSYVAPGASWRSSYDLRLAGDQLMLSWYGLISQQTGEDWPQCQLKLSTARPSGALAVPELQPWFIGRRLPPPPPSQPVYASADMAMPMSAAPAPPGAMPRGAAPKMKRAAVQEVTATVEQGAAAATYTPSRPVAVPDDGTTHRTVVATFELEAQLDHVTAPVRAAEATLRATVRNSSSHTLPPGRAALFHEGEFVGATQLEPWAPDEERELALGVDDRVRVERELMRRSATKATLGSTRRIDLEYKITVANHTPRSIAVTVLDQLPVSTDDQIAVRETGARPEPTERTDLNVLTWKLPLKAGAETTITYGLRVETGKNVDLNDPLLG